MRRFLANAREINDATNADEANKAKSTNNQAAVEISIQADPLLGFFFFGRLFLLTRAGSGPLLSKS